MTQQTKAAQLLVLATFLWGMSFPTMKSLGMLEQQQMPSEGSWFATSLTVLLRFGGAGLIMLPFTLRSIRQFTWLEISEGLGLGVFGGIGLIFQMDGLAYTSASTSAFLTQAYCVIIPVWTALWHKRLPSGRLVFSLILLMTGVAVLSNLDWRAFRPGRGELETLIAAAIFTGQILWLERPIYARNNTRHFSMIMFFTMAAMAIPVLVVTTQSAADLAVPFRSSGIIFLHLVLITFCTLGAYLLMNYWQPKVPAMEAALIYGAEPVFASSLSLFMPGWYSAFLHIHYPNERITSNLLIGGALILTANALVQLWPDPPSTRATQKL